MSRELLLPIGSKRPDPEFKELLKIAEAKGLKLEKKNVILGYVIKYSDGSVSRFKSFTAFSFTVRSFDK